MSSRCGRRQGQGWTPGRIHEDGDMIRIQGFIDTAPGTGAFPIPRFDVPSPGCRQCRDVCTVVALGVGDEI